MLSYYEFIIHDKKHPFEISFKIFLSQITASHCQLLSQVSFPLHSEDFLRIFHKLNPAIFLLCGHIPAWKALKVLEHQTCKLHWRHESDKLKLSA